jgi:transaldolase
MPESVIFAFEDHGTTRGDTVTGSYGSARKAMSDLAAVGIDFEDVVQVLEDEGVEKFETSWVELLEGVQKSLDAARKGSASPSDAA